MKDLIPFYGDRRVHRALDQAIGREQIMGVISGLFLVEIVRLYMKLAIATVLVGKSLAVAFYVRLGMWHAAFVGGILLAAYWREVEAALDEATNTDSKA